MTATLQDIKGWLETAQTSNATHLIVAVDKFDYDNYPVYVQEHENVQHVYDRIMKSKMQSVGEVYNMSMNIEEQLKQVRAKNF